MRALDPMIPYVVLEFFVFVVRAAGLGWRGFPLHCLQLEAVR